MANNVKNCEYCNKEFFKPKPYFTWRRWSLRRFCSKPCAGKITCKDRPQTFKKGFIPKYKGKNMPAGFGEKIASALKGKYVGEKSWNWKGGKYLERHRIMSRSDYRNWRKAVLDRDEYICQMCKIKTIKVHADHIKSFALFPKLRFEISNGRTLCIPCHYLVTFGKSMDKNIKWGFI